MANFFDFSSDQVHVTLMLIDSSGSMRDQKSAMKEGLTYYQKYFEGLPEANSMAISNSNFDSDLRLGAFRPLSEFDTSYNTDGWTAIYYAIVQASHHLLNYMEEVAKKTGIRPQGTLMVFSDGHSEHDRATFGDAKETVEKLNTAGINTVFVAFGEAIEEEYGKALGFLATKDVKDRGALPEFFEEFSEASRRQSQTRKSLGANFFSNVQSSSAGYSNRARQALEDDSWFDDI